MGCPFSLRNKPDLCPKGIDLGVTPSAPSCPPTLLDEKEDWRQRDKEKQVSPIYPWDHMHRAGRETENSHKICCLFMKHPPGEIISLWELISLVLIKKYKKKKIKEGLGDYLEDTEKYIRAFKGVTLFYYLTWKVVMYILGQMLTPDSKTRVLGKAVAYGDEWFGNESARKKEDKTTALPVRPRIRAFVPRRKNRATQ